jgi:hypothetical protein
MDIGDGKTAAATGGEAVCGEVRAERRRRRMDIRDGKVTTVTCGGAGDCMCGRGVESQQVVRGAVEMVVDICPHCCRCALPRPSCHRIAPPGSPVGAAVAAAASATDHHRTSMAQEEEERWVPCAERERGVRTADGRVPHGKHNSFITDGWVPRVGREREG